MNQMQDTMSLISQLNAGSANDPDAEWKAAIALAEVQSFEQKLYAVDALIDAVIDGWAHALVRAHAVKSLGKLGDRRAVPALTFALYDPYQLVRTYAIAPLAELGDAHKVVDPLLNVLERDEFFDVRAEAVRAIVTLAIRAGDTSLRKRVRNTLIRRRKNELMRWEKGTERVIAEINRALKQLDDEEDKNG